MMTVTSWGYDVVQYDADALILNNPSELFERHPDSDIVASRARHWPPKVGDLLLVRVSSFTEVLPK